MCVCAPTGNRLVRVCRWEAIQHRRACPHGDGHSFLDILPQVGHQLPKSLQPPPYKRTHAHKHARTQTHPHNSESPWNSPLRSSRTTHRSGDGRLKPLCGPARAPSLPPSESPSKPPSESPSESPRSGRPNSQPGPQRALLRLRLCRGKERAAALGGGRPGGVGLSDGRGPLPIAVCGRTGT